MKIVYIVGNLAGGGVQRVIENFIIYQQIIIDNSIKNKKNIGDLLY